MDQLTCQCELARRNLAETGLLAFAGDLANYGRRNSSRRRLARGLPEPLGEYLFHDGLAAHGFTAPNALCMELVACIFFHWAMHFTLLTASCSMGA